MLLFLNACVRSDSRTKRLADCLLDALRAPVTELRLADMPYPVTDAAFLNRRDQLLAEKAYDDPMFALARQFAEADEIVLAAPFWDLSFPASVKAYFEQINVVGVTFRYTPEGIPEGLCRAKRLIYVTTAGGTFFPGEYGFGYIEALARNFYGIPDVQLVQATGLDIDGAPVEEILCACEAEIRRRFWKAEETGHD